jgi:DNA-directed RNA polymerase specialized sigma24 family protein
MPAHYQQKRRVTAREGAAELGITARQVRRLVALPRDEWIQQMAADREAIRVYHDDGGHSWRETGEHFGISEPTARERGYRARKERAREAEEAAKGPQLPFDEDAG